MAPERALALLDLYVKAGEPGRISDMLAWLGRNVPVLSDGQLVTALQLARSAQRPDALADLIGRIGARPSLGRALATELLRIAHAAEDRRLADSVAAGLSGRVAPADRPGFLTDAARMRMGPLAALDHARQQRQAGRSPRGAAVLGRLLIDAGQTRLAQRYLRRCARRWPNAPAIPPLLIAAFIQSGYPDRGLEWLERRRGDRPRAEEQWLYYRLYLESGDLDRALEVTRAQIAAGQRKPGDPWLLRVLLALGRLEEAETVAAIVRSDTTVSVKAAAHFGIGVNGAQLNDLRLYRRAAGTAPGLAPSAEQAAVFFHAAGEVLDRWTDAPAGDGSGAVPRRIVQYWNDPRPPDEVAEVMRSWQAAPGWQYRRFDRRQAAAWLAETCGPDHARAFGLARHVAEEADFFRLCILHASGGIYADADDLLTGTPDAIAAEGPGLVLFRENFGAVANNVICAPPGHPAIGQAVALAMEALLRRDNDSPWSKTGPGLLSRAVAVHLIEDAWPHRPALTLRPISRLRRQVHLHVRMPYKGTARYWNARTDRTAGSIARALGAFVDADPDGRGIAP